MKTLAFYKMHSLGNDFMIVDGVSRAFSVDTQDIASWSDRNRGVGFDQLLVIEPPTAPEADFFYRIYNADGSEAEQCGNGTRCVATLAKLLRLSPKEELTWQSLAGDFTTQLLGDQVATEMTVPTLDHENIPFDASAATYHDDHRYVMTDNDIDYAFTPVSMGNPHAVIFMDSIFDLDVPGIGARLTQHASFPNHANISFCQVMDSGFMRLRVYERGTGETQACGSGACAAVVAARLNGLAGQRVKVSLPGGKLKITWPGEGERVSMTGPSSLSYKGEITLNEI
jgi:diaminopimelate epimerase